MKKIIITTLITILAFGSLKANCAVIKSSDVKAVVLKQVRENYQRYTDAQLDIKVVTVPFVELEVPNGEITYSIKPSADKFMPRDLEKVTIYVNGNPVRSFNIPIVVKAYEDVLVASGFINREAQINSSVVTIKKKEISNIMEYPLRAKDLGKDILAKKAFSEGEIIDSRFVKQRPDILRSATVTVVFNTNNLTISTDATALSDGVVGDNICVMNKNYNKVYTGTIIGENKVLVKL